MGETLRDGVNSIFWAPGQMGYVLIDCFFPFSWCSCSFNRSMKLSTFHTGPQMNSIGSSTNYQDGLNLNIVRSCRVAKSWSFIHMISSSVFVLYGVTPTLLMTSFSSLSDLYADEDMTIRIYHDMNTGRWWWDMQVCIRVDTFLLFFMLMDSE